MPAHDTSAIHADRIAEAVRRAEAEAHPSPPNRVAQELALRVMVAAEAAGVEFTLVAAGAEECVDLGVTFKTGKYCLFSCFNDGRVLLTLVGADEANSGTDFYAFSGSDQSELESAMGRVRALSESV